MPFRLLLCCLLMAGMLRGCTVSTGFYVEKQWCTDPSFSSPDLNTKWKIETSKKLGEP